MTDDKKEMTKEQARAIQETVMNLCNDMTEFREAKIVMYPIGTWKAMNDVEFITNYSLPNIKYITPFGSNTYKYIEERRCKLGLTKAQEIK
jgi:hypothetical protein